MRNGKTSVLKDDLIQGMAVKSGLTQTTCKLAFNALISTINEGLNDNKVVYVDGLGDFEVREISSKITTNPVTREKMTVAPVKTVRYKPSVSVKKAINK